MLAQGYYLLASQRQSCDDVVASCELGESPGLRLPDQQGTCGHPNQKVHCPNLQRGEQDALIQYLRLNIVTCG